MGWRTSPAKTAPSKAGSHVARSQVKLDVKVQSTPNAVIERKAPNGYSTLGERAAAELKAKDPAFNRSTPRGQAAVDGIRNARLAESVAKNGHPHTSVKVGGGQSFEILKPDALKGAQIEKLTARVNPRLPQALQSYQASRLSGSQLAKEVLSGHADAAAKTARAIGANAGQVKWASRAATASKVVGRVAVPIGVGLDVAAVVTSNDKVRTGVAKASAWGTAFAGAKGGAALGASIGALGGPLGAAAGGVIGGLAGGIGGYFGGEWLGGKAVDSVRGWFG